MGFVDDSGKKHPGFVESDTSAAWFDLLVNKLGMTPVEYREKTNPDERAWLEAAHQDFLRRQDDEMPSE